MDDSGILYHFTSRRAWEQILADGAIEATSMWAELIEGRRPLVWLADSSDPTHSGLNEDGRTTVRIEVQPAFGVRYWGMWRYLTTNAEHLERWGDPSTWYVSPLPILMIDWRKVVDQECGKVLWEAEGTLCGGKWGPLPTLDEVDRIGAFLHDGYRRRAEAVWVGADESACALLRASLVPQQIAKMHELLDQPEEHRARAGWRSLCGQASALPGGSPEWLLLDGPWGLGNGW